MRLGLIGAGNMASALARGLGEPVLVSDVQHERAEALAAEVGGRALTSNAELARAADVVVLCHKPPQLREVAAEVAAEARAVVTILAATTTRAVEDAYPGIPVYRFIPSIPAEVRRGVLCYAPGSLAADGPERELLALFGRVGVVVPLDEPLIEPAMALMSSGPAFMALVAEAFAAAGAAHGLEPRDAIRLTVETMAGTATWLAANGYDAAALRARVATPGGVTQRGLLALEGADLAGACRRAVDTVVDATR
ncbi:MAG: pyrroline-5-carboxylate reductase family protein [Nocardioidaceae bacterium]